MSLGYIFVKCRDGKYYRGLSYESPDNTWFICFDEDEPVEIVLRKTCRIAPELILSELGFTRVQLKRAWGGCRMFGNKLRPADSFFIPLDNGLMFPIPRPGIDKWDEVYNNRPGLEGTYFGCGSDIN